MDAFNLLKADHEKVAELFDRLERASGKEKLRVFEQIKTELELHTHIEEKIFYPALEKPEETHDLTLEAYEEHDVVKKLLRSLSRSKTADDEWQAQAKVLQENVEHHVEEEENELFPKADSALSDEEIEKLGRRMETEKARKQGRAGSKASAAKSSAKSSGARKTAPSKKTGAKKRGGSKKGGSKKGGSKKAGKRSSKSSASKTAKRSRSRKSTRR